MFGCYNCLMNKESVKVVSYDYKRDSYKTWNSSIIDQDREKILTCHEYPFIITNSSGEVKRFNIAVAVTHFFNRWFNIIAVFNKKKTFIHWYVNLTTPIQFDGTTITYEDLLLDLRVRLDFSWELLDQDEYDAHVSELGAETVDMVNKTMQELTTLLSTKSQLFTSSWIDDKK